MATKHSGEQAIPSIRAIAPSSQAEMDQALNVLATHKNDWAMMDIPGRIALLDSTRSSRICQRLKSDGLW